MSKVFGVDVSEHQGAVDWSAMKKAGVQFAIIRCGLGGYYDNKPRVDEYFAKNVKGCESNNIPYGVYYFCYARNINEVSEECEHAKSIIKSTCSKKPFMVCYDFEYDTITKAERYGVTLGKKEFNNFVLKWNKYFTELGYQTPVYLNLDYYNRMYDAGVLKQYPIWCASYASSCAVPGYSVWQFTDKHPICGTTMDGDYTTTEFISAGSAQKNTYKKETTTSSNNGGVKTLTNEQAKNYTQQLLGHYPFVYCPTLAAKTSNHTPHAGDIVLFYFNGDYGHTGYVYAVDGTYFYTIEGNTSGGSTVVANGGGTFAKSYRISSYTTSKFYRPDYSILVKNGIFASTSAAINAVTATAKNEIGYLEKASLSGSNLDSKTSGAGYNNYTKYWRDVYPAYQAQPWCACFVTWIIQNAIMNGGDVTSTGYTNNSSVTTNAVNNTAAGGTTFANVKSALSTYGTAKQWKNGSTEEIVYADSAKKNKIGTLDPYDGAAMIGRQGAMYVVAYKIDGANDYKVGFVGYAGGTSVTANVVKVWKNGSTSETVYANTSMSKEIGSLDPRESCSCLGSINNRKIVLYKVDGTSYYKTGVVEYNGGL